MDSSSVHSGRSVALSAVSSEDIADKSDKDMKELGESGLAESIALRSEGWRAVFAGDINSVMKLYPSKEDVYERGRYGENVFLVAVSLNNPQAATVAKYLAKTFGPKLVRTPYQVRLRDTDTVGLFEGQTALHLAVINNDMDMLKFLINMGADTRARAIGRFFAFGGNAYYGEYPLSFAASLGNKDAALFLLRHGSSVKDKDTQGNTALHLSVVHGRLEMYDFLVDVLKASEGEYNKQGMTPLMLAAQTGDREMFQHIYTKRVAVAWKYGKIRSFWVPLMELDVTEPDQDPEHTCFGIALRTGNTHLFDDNVMFKIFEAKRARLAPFMYVGTFCYLLLMIALTFMVDRTVRGTSVRGVVLALHVVVFTYIFTQMLQAFYLFVDRVHRGTKYIQEQSEMTSLVPIFSGHVPEKDEAVTTGPGDFGSKRASVESGGRNSLQTTRRQVHANRKSFQLPKEMLANIKSTVVGGSAALFGYKRKSLAESRGVPGHAVPIGGAPVEPPLANEAGFPMAMDGGAGPSTSPQGGERINRIAVGAIQNRTKTRVSKPRTDGRRDSVQTDNTQPSAYSGGTDQHRDRKGSIASMPSDFTRDDDAYSEMPRRASEIYFTEFADQNGQAGGHAPLTYNRFSRPRLFFRSIRRELTNTAAEGSTLVLLGFHLFSIAYFIVWLVRTSGNGHEGAYSPRPDPAARVLLALMACTGWLSAMMSMRTSFQFCRLISLMEHLIGGVVKIALAFIICLVGFATALFSLRSLSGGPSNSFEESSSDIRLVILRLFRSVFSADSADDPTSYDTGSGVVTGFTIIIGLGFFLTTVLLGMALVRETLQPYDMRRDNGDRDVSYYRFFVGMTLLRMWALVPRRFRHLFILGDKVTRADGTSMRFLQYVEGSRATSKANFQSRRSRDEERSKRSESDTKKQADGTSLASRIAYERSSMGTVAPPGPATTGPPGGSVGGMTSRS